MSKPMATEDAEKETLRKENEGLNAIVEDLGRAYAVLYDAAEGVLACEDLVLKNGSQQSILKICELVRKAMREAERLHYESFAAPSADEFCWCDRCQRFLNAEEELAGQCLTCRFPASSQV